MYDRGRFLSNNGFFDGGKDLFKFLLSRGENAAGKRPEITAIFVTDYYRLEVIPAREAYFVAGSDVYGPMGPELVPHPNRAQAEEFSRDHGGTGIFSFKEVTAEVLDSLPAVRESDAETLIAAPGTSCRHQILDGSGRVAHHPAEILFAALETEEAK